MTCMRGGGGACASHGDCTGIHATPYVCCVQWQGRRRVSQAATMLRFHGRALWKGFGGHLGIFTPQVQGNACTYLYTVSLGLLVHDIQWRPWIVAGANAAIFA